jgi:ATP-binding protein involved in chromosome partitioning
MAMPFCWRRLSSAAQDRDLPQLVSLEDASRGLNMFRTLEVPILGIIENMSYLDLPDGTRMDLFGSGGGEQLAQAAQANFLGKVPIDQNVRIGGDSGKPILVSHPIPRRMPRRDLQAHEVGQINEEWLPIKL